MDALADARVAAAAGRVAPDKPCGARTRACRVETHLDATSKKYTAPPGFHLTL
jgi:hypothetical protein